MTFSVTEPRQPPLPWVDPLDAAQAATSRCWVLLHSAPGTAGRTSWLALGPQETVTGEHFHLLAPRLSTDLPALENAWFGYLGYPLRHDTELLPHDPPGPIRLPALWMTRFADITRFDRQTKNVTRAMATLTAADREAGDRSTEVMELRSNMTKQDYLQHVAAILKQIQAGNLYQANLTRKFFGRFRRAPDAYALFRRLCRASPAPYSAFIKLDEDTHLLSSSPESFLSMNAPGHVVTRPIKGSAPRSSDPAQDNAAREALVASAKDRAENLMIVDLMRNDLSRACTTGSVRVESLFDVTTHATVHHLSSSIAGLRRSDVTPLQLVERCFPPGSMTGAPKIRAMRLCSALEGVERGVYSGALGWFGGDGSCELSVIIRTLILQGDRFEFQVGGGIVADSDPETEWRETMSKASGIAEALGVKLERLERL